MYMAKTVKKESKDYMGNFPGTMKGMCVYSGIRSGLNPVPPLAGSVTSIKLFKLGLFPYIF